MVVVEVLHGDESTVAELAEVHGAEPAVADLALVVEAVGGGLKLLVGEHRREEPPVVAEEHGGWIFLRRQCLLHSTVPLSENQRGYGNKD